MRWRWIWLQSCTAMAPYLAPRLDIQPEIWLDGRIIAFFLAGRTHYNIFFGWTDAL